MKEYFARSLIREISQIVFLEMVGMFRAVPSHSCQKCPCTKIHAVLCPKINISNRVFLLFSPPCPRLTLGSPKSSTGCPPIKEAALRAASKKGGGHRRRPPRFVDSFMDERVVAIQVEFFFWCPSQPCAWYARQSKSLEFFTPSCTPGAHP